MLKFKDIKNLINYDNNTKILVFNEDSTYKDITIEVFDGFNKSPYDNYYVLNIYLHLNTITLIAY